MNIKFIIDQVNKLYHLSEPSCDLVIGEILIKMNFYIDESNDYYLVLLSIITVFVIVTTTNEILSKIGFTKRQADDTIYISILFFF